MNNALCCHAQRPVFIYIMHKSCKGAEGEGTEDIIERDKKLFVRGPEKGVDLARTFEIIKKVPGMKKGYNTLRIRKN